MSTADDPKHAAFETGPAPAPDDHVTVMVVDDRKPNRTVLVRLASELSRRADVRAFSDGHAALEAAQSAPPDLVITDYKMPGITGADFVKALRSRAETTDVPVIVVTAYEDKQFRYDALKAGASDFLLSPVDKFEFVQRGRNLLTMRRQQQELARQAEARERRLAQRNQLREQELQLSEEKFQLVVNTLPALVTAVDVRGTLSFVNAACARQFGLDDPQHAIGARLHDVLPADVATRHACADSDVLKTGGTVSFEEDVPTPGDASRTLLTSKAPLYDAHERAVNVITVAVDISDLKTVERELQSAKKDAQNANRTKTEFLANISHELRTPLNAIMGFADVGRKELLGPLGSPRYKQYLEDIHGAGSQLLGLIDDLLDISRLELGQLQTNPEHTDLRAEIDYAVSVFKPEAAARNIRIEPDVAAHVPRVYTDRMRFRQILTNLVSNAVKYSASGGCIQVTLNAAEHGGVELTVRDDGPGMTAEELQKALSRFGRLGHPDTQTRSGVGLGLPIAQDLARLLGGTLTVHTAKGYGTRIVVRLDNMPTEGAVSGIDWAGKGAL